MAIAHVDIGLFAINKVAMCERFHTVFMGDTYVVWRTASVVALQHGKF